MLITVYTLTRCALAIVITLVIGGALFAGAAAIASIMQ